MSLQSKIIGAIKSTTNHLSLVLLSLKEKLGYHNAPHFLIDAL